MERPGDQRQHPIALWLKQAHVAALREESCPEFRVKLVNRDQGTSERRRVGAIWVKGVKVWEAGSGLKVPITLDLSWPVPDSQPVYLSIASGGKKDASASSQAQRTKLRRRREP